ncbi:DNA polymerase IV [Candidatus Gracilibacteria bacterium]|nr:DNA polymerase IV [Candidatus Gracilibacteria bacterium]
MNFQTSRHIYAHIDCNSFYASCEVLRDPSLKGRCLCVGDQISIAASYEAKRYGIKTGTPLWEAKRILGKKLIIKPPDHAWYRQVSERLMKYLTDKLGKIEVFSIDELFAELTHIPGRYDDFAESLKEEIYHDIGIPVSIGISNTRIRAKMFGDLNKPFGSYVDFNTADIEELWKTLPVTEVPYIAKGNSTRLGANIKTVYDFYAMEGMAVSNILGRNGSTLWLELHGVDCWVPHDTNKKRKSIACTRSFNHTMTDSSTILWNQVLFNFERAYETMLAEKQGARVIGVFLRTKEFTYTNRAFDMGEVNIDRPRMLEILKNLFESVYSQGIIYRTTGVTFSELSSFTPKQLSLFDIPDTVHIQNERVSNVLTKLKTRFGEGVISQGILKSNKKQDLEVLFEVG